MTAGGTDIWDTADGFHFAYKQLSGEGNIVAREDNTGNSAVVTYPDPAASTTGSWTEWNIPFTGFTGVNMQAISKMSIGVGDRANTQPAGAGDLYIDDIRLNRP